MYYVLFETGNETFFSRIADEFSLIVVKDVVDHYESTSVSQQNQKILKPFNCVSFSRICCENRECVINNKAVLTSNQLDKFEVSMTNANFAFFKSNNYLRRPRDRLNIQKMFQNYKTADIQGIEFIPLENKQDHDEYLRLYIKKTNELKNKAEGFVYVRSETDSDFDFFVRKTSLPNVMVCDCFQSI